MLAAGERRIPRGAAQAGGGAGEDDRAAAPLQHVLRRLAAGEKRAQRAHFPDLEIDPRGRLEDREPHIAAYIVNADLDGADVALDPLEQLDDLLLAAGVAAERMRLAAIRPDLFDHRGELVAVPAREAGNETLARKTPRDGAPGVISGPDHQYRL